MIKIKFTCGESNIWQCIELDWNLSHNEIKDVDDIAYFIKLAQSQYKQLPAKKVEVLDESGRVLAKSDDILCKFNFNIEYNE